MLRAARDAGLDRWVRFLAPLPDLLRDGPYRDLRPAARHARAAFGPKDSIRDAVSGELTEPMLDAVDRLLKAIAKHEVQRS